MARGCGAPGRGVRSRSARQGQGTALCTCAIGDCSWLVCVQGKARCAGNGLSPWQAPQRSHGRTQANPKGGTRLSRPGVAPLAKAISLPCAPRLVAKQPGVAAAVNDTGAECLGRLSFVPFFGRAKKGTRRVTDSNRCPRHRIAHEIDHNGQQLRRFQIRKIKTTNAERRFAPETGLSAPNIPPNPVTAQPNTPTPSKNSCERLRSHLTFRDAPIDCAARRLATPPPIRRTRGTAASARPVPAPSPPPRTGD